MYQSDKINELATALSKAQSEMNSASKGSVNPFHKSKYSNINDIISASRDALTKNGLSIVQVVIPHNIESNSNGMALMTELLHSSGQWIRSVMPLILTKTDPQSIGAILTYYRRYSYSALVGIVTESDDDAESVMDRKQKAIQQEILEAPEPKISKEQCDFLNELMGENQDIIDIVKKQVRSCGANAFSALPAKEFKRFETGIKDLLKKKTAQKV